MRRRIVFSLAAFFLVVGILALVYNHLVSEGNAGYVIVGIGNWVLETSLYLVIVTVATLFLVVYLSVRLTAKAAQLPETMKRRAADQRSSRSREALVSGLIQTTEGRWEKAERSLIRYAADSTIPLINYLTAARAAHARGAYEQREQYLKLAQASVPEADLAIGLVRAELQLSTRQFDEALKTLNALRESSPGHAAVLRLLHQVYAQTADWVSLHNLMPHLRNSHVMTEAEVKQLEVETYTELLREKARTRSASQVREIWRHVPVYIQRMSGIEALYCSAMIDAGVGAEIEEEARLALGKDWDETLLTLYGSIEMEDSEKHLHNAEEWLAPHPEDPVLFVVLARLALKAGEAGKARDYVEQSLALKPSIEGYRLIGEMLQELSDFESASDYYHKGLMLVSRSSESAQTLEDASV